MAGTVIPMISLLTVVALGLLVTRVGTVMLMLTGLSRDLARFQARSAFTGVGFTTQESEQIVSHPVRRRIVLWLMLLGNAGLIAAISSLLPVFIQSETGSSDFLRRILLLVCGLTLLGAMATSEWLDRQLTRVIAWALKRWTNVDAFDYSRMLHLASGYSVSELVVDPGDWLEHKSLADVRLGDEGVQVLGIRRKEGGYVGAPTGKTMFLAGDVLVVYGRSEQLAELAARRAGRGGDEAHKKRVEELRATLVMQEDQELRRLRETLAAEDKAEQAGEDSRAAGQ